MVLAKRVAALGARMLRQPALHAMLMSPHEGETTVHGMTVRMRKLLARPWAGVRVYHLHLRFYGLLTMCTVR